MDVSSSESESLCDDEVQDEEATQKAVDALGDSAAAGHLQKALKKMGSTGQPVDASSLCPLFVQGILAGMSDVMDKALAKHALHLSELLAKSWSRQSNVSVWLARVS